MKRHSFAQFLRVVTEGTPQQDAAAQGQNAAQPAPQVPPLRKADQGIMEDFHRLRDAVIGIKQDWDTLKNSLSQADTSMQAAGVSWTAQINSMQDLQKAYVTLAQRYDKSKVTIKKMVERHKAALLSVGNKMSQDAQGVLAVVNQANQSLIQTKEDEIEALQEEMENLAQTGDTNLDQAKKVMAAFEKKITALNNTISYLQEQNAKYVEELQKTSRFVHDQAAQATAPVQNAHTTHAEKAIMEYLEREKAGKPHFE